MRVLIGPDTSDLATLYAVPRTPWLRVNMVATVDGSATGDSGRSGSINNAADKRVFDTLRRLADVVVVGAGTARVEEYGPTDRPVVVVSRRGEVPETLRGAEPGAVRLATCAAADGLTAARDLLGPEHVLVLGDHRVDLERLRDVLAGQGLRHVLCEGGPHLLRDLLAVGAVNELCATVVPRLVAGDHPRITSGPPVDAPLTLHTLLEDDGTLLARWLVG
ncbi:dihydrofolate reductase family protein [Nocardioides sp. SYSU D00038]|uniref:dihydrofolate reductase family protein n=1 Tax=Nocardioides sp. SYSU D00038 TaxID=2812554 RepID=UPI0019675357|nr:dihydrofolate reductase family protein [Nocardioides sp. SYSU D00038]